jgi:hypothetical protein
MCQCGESVCSSCTTETLLKLAQELLRASMDQNIRKTEAITELQCDLDRFLAAYGVDGETDLRGYKG